jgi:hypothetical protein
VSTSRIWHYIRVNQNNGKRVFSGFPCFENACIMQK